jgi:hypothetical protein
MKQTHKAAKRAGWMATVEAMIITERPDLAGKIDWDTLAYLYNTGINEALAASKILAKVKA